MGVPQLRGRPALLLALACLLMAVAAGCRSGPPPIVFASDRDGNLEIYRMTATGGDIRNLTSSPLRDWSPVVSPDRKRVAFLTEVGEGDAIDVMELGGRSRTRLTASGPRHRGLRWSPGSNRIAYVAEQEGGPFIYVADLRQSQPQLLTTLSTDDPGDWSPDGQWVAFSVRDGGARGIYIRNPDGVNQKQLSSGPDYSPRWSPDSRWIAFLSDRDGNPEIYLMSASDGSGLRRLTQTEAPEYQMSWSPDSKRLLFVSERDGNPEIYTAGIEGDGQARLTFNGVADEQPQWSPDGKRIVFVSHLYGNPEIIVMDADGRNQSRLTTSPGQDVSPSW